MEATTAWNTDGCKAAPNIARVGHWGNSVHVFTVVMKALLCWMRSVR